MKSDDEIRKNVLEEIQWDAQLTKIAPQIGVIVKNEVVTLSGDVDYYRQKLATEKAAKKGKGCKSSTACGSQETNQSLISPSCHC